MSVYSGQFQEGKYGVRINVKFIAGYLKFDYLEEDVEKLINDILEKEEKIFQKKNLENKMPKINFLDIHPDMIAYCNKHSHRVGTLEDAIDYMQKNIVGDMYFKRKDGEKIIYIK